MTSVAEAKELVGRYTQVGKPLRLPLMDARGLVAAEDMFSPIDIPAFLQSSMDGYAFAFESLADNAPLEIVGTMAAGTQRPIGLEKGQAARIFTGAPLPNGADTVVMQERCTTEAGLLKLDFQPAKGEHVRLPGTEAAKGTLALPAGTRLQPAAIGFLSGLGITEALVLPTPSVTLIVTGDELQEPGLPLGFGQVYESNSRSLEAALRQLGVQHVRKMGCKDDPVSLWTRLSEALEGSDMVLLTGGVSVGDHDHVLKATEECGVEKVFHRVSQKPGKPLYFGIREGKPVFGLPGNPASVLTCFYEYVCTALDRICGWEGTVRTRKATLRVGLRKPAGLTHFLKARMDGEYVRVLDGQESYKLNGFAKADCLVVLQEQLTECMPGDQVEVHLLP